MSFVAILTSVISASYYLRVVALLVEKKTQTKTPSASSSSSLINSSSSSDSITVKVSSSQLETLDTLDILNNTNNNSEILTNLHSFLISTITLSILLFILKPTILLNSTQLLSLSLFYS
jgi:NADH-ubiquinone oxidoreductase chain 2